MANTPQSRKAKGRRLQQYVRDAVLQAFPFLHPDDVRNTPMGSSGTDLMLSPAAQKHFPYGLECKNQESLSVWAAIKQAISNTKTGQFPLVIFKRNNTETYAILPFEHLMDLLKNQKGE